MNPSFDDKPQSAANIDRRSFVKLVPAAAVTALAGAKTATEVMGQAAASPSPSPSPTPARPSPLAEAYAEVAKQRFGKHIEEGQWERVKRDLEGNVRAADRLRDSKLKNSDEPDFIFIA